MMSLFFFFGSSSFFQWDKRDWQAWRGWTRLARGAGFLFHVAQGNFPGEPSCVFHVEYKPECFLDCPFCHCWPTFNMRLIALRTRSLDRIPDCYVIPNNWNHSRIRGYLSCVFARMFNLTYSSKEGLQMVYTTWSPKIEKLHYSLTLSALPESHFSARLTETNLHTGPHHAGCQSLRCGCAVVTLLGHNTRRPGHGPRVWTVFR